MGGGGLLLKDFKEIAANEKGYKLFSVRIISLGCVSIPFK